jgi:hypothetical protein
MDPFKPGKSGSGLCSSQWEHARVSLIWMLVTRSAGAKDDDTADIVKNLRSQIPEICNPQLWISNLVLVLIHTNAHRPLPRKTAI